jgi:hypothetical protein
LTRSDNGSVFTDQHYRCRWTGHAVDSGAPEPLSSSIRAPVRGKRPEPLSGNNTSQDLPFLPWCSGSIEHC